eukprot:4877597-Prymnesium_polylepis.2
MCERTPASLIVSGVWLHLEKACVDEHLIAVCGTFLRLVVPILKCGIPCGLDIKALRGDLPWEAGKSNAPQAHARANQ